MPNELRLASSLPTAYMASEPSPSQTNSEHNIPLKYRLAFTILGLDYGSIVELFVHSYLGVYITA